MEKSKVAEAALNYEKGNYAKAYEIYKKLSELIGLEFFSANIKICEKRLGFLPDKSITQITTENNDKKKNNISLKNYQDASKYFYQYGNLLEVQKCLNFLLEAGEKFDKKQRDFKAFVDGLVRLQEGWKVIPPRQPNAGIFTRHKHALYCLHQSVPHSTNGYSTRSHGVAIGLKKAGWKVRVATRPGFPWDANVAGLNRGYHETSVDGIEYASIAGWNLNNTPLDLYLAEAADHFVREAQSSGAEVIISASNHITALPALVAARRLGLPFVYEIRGLWEVTQASVQPNWADSQRYHLMRTLEQQVAKESNLVITLTDELRQEISSWGISKEKIILVPNAVDTERFQPQPADEKILKELNIPVGTPVIGYAGSVVAYEGLNLLLDALFKIKQKKEKFVFVLVGDGKVIDEIKARATSLGLEKECRFVGRIPFDKVAGYLSCMDIMPIPRLSSPVTEMVSALKPLEAMAMGRAVVLSNVSPHKTMAGNNERAILFKKDDADDLAKNIQRLMHAPDERARLGNVARQWVLKERTWNYVTEVYAKAVEKAKEATKEIFESESVKNIKNITLGIIADQFTTDTLASAVKVVPLSPDNWEKEIASISIDAIFVESAWKGNNGQWHRRVGYYSDEEFSPLNALLSHCRKKGIPSLFWNKEDPVHFERFRKAASLCDHVFTTDSRRIIPYLSTLKGFTKTASSCAFYASPDIHNLLPAKREWVHTAAYGGTYYGERYPERTEYMDKIMSAAAPLGLTIYDRQHSDPESPYKYPAGLSSHVAGGLSYAEMIQAYKAHPVQINVNSVLDSPTMFSRRVAEIAASGVPLISGPALGMNRYLEGAAHIVTTESEAAEALENLMRHPAYRWRVGLKGARAIMRAHTTQHRLTQMLRTAGFVILAPEVPKLHLYATQISAKGATQLLSQTLLPNSITANAWNAEIKHVLEQAGINCLVAEYPACSQETVWIVANPEAIENLEAEDFEDLAWVSTYAPHERIAFKRDISVVEGEWPGITLESQSFDANLQLIRVSRKDGIANVLDMLDSSSPILALRKPAKAHEKAPENNPKKTVLIAGHDLKFIRPFYRYFTAAGFRLLLDFWNSHSQHKEAASKRLIEQADTVFCEWMLGNAIWYAKNKRPHQKLIGRLHAQELRSPLFEKVPFHSFEKVIFVAPHMLRQAAKRNPVFNKNGIVIYNGVDIEKLQSVPRKTTNGKVLGLVGMVPQSKRIDLALDILAELRKTDKEYVLRIKGKRPEDFPWMLNRKEEMDWYQKQYERMENDPLLVKAVFFDPYGDDMADWYSGIDYILSTSDYESFHYSIADGAAVGCIPIIRSWLGSCELYDKSFIFNNLDEVFKLIKYSRHREFDEKIKFFKKFDIKIVSKEILSVL